MGPTRVADPLLDAAERRPDAVAVEDGVVRWTYGELAQRAGRLAGGLRDAGIRTGDRVALVAAPGATAIAAIHGCRLGGAILVPIDRRLPPAALAAMLRDRRVDLTVDGAADALSVSDAAAALSASSMRRVRLDALDGPPTAQPAHDRAPAVIVATSGTTGRPRGAILTTANLIASAESWIEFLAAGPDDAWLLAVPLHHVAGIGIVVRAALAGALLHVHPRYDAARVRDALVADRIAFVSLVPTQLAALLDAGPFQAPSLRAVLLGGAPIPPALVDHAVGVGLPVVPTYGLTEAASGVTALPAEEASRAPGSSGRPLPGVNVRIDGDGPAGEILVGGPVVFAGYDGDAHATARALDAGGWLHTGDIGTLDAERRLTVLDRRDDLIVSGGENVYPAHVEHVLTRTPGIRDAAVVGRQHARWGSVPVAAVVADPAGHTDPRAVLRFAREHLPAPAVPAGVVLLPALPRSSGGKLRRLEVRALVERGPTVEEVRRPDGAVIVVRRRGSGPVLVLCHATLSSAAELDALAGLLGERFAVLAADRRTAGQSESPPGWDPAAVDVGVHVADLIAVLDASGLPPPALLVGHSYGACLALEALAREPDRFAGAWLFEPPYVPLAPVPVRRAFRGLGDRVASAAAEHGLGEAAIAFIAAVAGEEVTARLPEAARVQLRTEGRSALADASLLGLDPLALAGIARPVEVATGGRSEPFYAQIAAAIVDTVPGATAKRFDDLSHGGPVSRPETIAPAVEAFAERVGVPQP